MAAILSPVMEFVIGFVSKTSTTDVLCHYALFSERRSLNINKWMSYSQLSCFTAAILFRHLGICNPICGTL